MPVRISDIRIHGIKNTREGFLQGVFAEALSAQRQHGYTLKSAMDELQRTTDKLHRFGRWWWWRRWWGSGGGGGGAAAAAAVAAVAAVAAAVAAVVMGGVELEVEGFGGLARAGHG